MGMGITYTVMGIYSHMFYAAVSLLRYQQAQLQYRVPRCMSKAQRNGE